MSLARKNQAQKKSSLTAKAEPPGVDNATQAFGSSQLFGSSQPFGTSQPFGSFQPQHHISSLPNGTPTGTPSPSLHCYPKEPQSPRPPSPSQAPIVGQLSFGSRSSIPDPQEHDVAESSQSAAQLQEPASPAPSEGLTLITSTEIDELSSGYQIPAPDSRGELISHLRGFVRQLSKHIEGPPLSQPAHSTIQPPKGLIEEVNAAYGRFRLGVLKTSPRFHPWDATYSPGSNIIKAMISNAESDDASGGHGIVLHLDEVMSLINRSHVRDLPGTTPFSVKESLIKESTKEWKELASRCCVEVETIIFRHLSQILQAHLGSHPSVDAALLKEVKRVLATEIRKCRRSMDEKITFLCRAEEQIYTQNKEVYVESRDKWHNKYSALFRQSQGGVAGSLGQYNPMLNDGSSTWSNINKAISGMTALGISVQPQDLARLLPTDPMDPAVQIMAEVRAYFDIAYKRFSDVIPQQLDLTFLRGLEETVDIALTRFAMSLSADDCARFLSEPKPGCEVEV